MFSACFLICFLKAAGWSFHHTGWMPTRVYLGARLQVESRKIHPVGHNQAAAFLINHKNYRQSFQKCFICFCTFSIRLPFPFRSWTYLVSCTTLYILCIYPVIFILSPFQSFILILFYLFLFGLSLFPFFALLGPFLLSLFPFLLGLSPSSFSLFLYCFTCSFSGQACVFVLGLYKFACLFYTTLSFFIQACIFLSTLCLFYPKPLSKKDTTLCFFRTPVRNYLFCIYIVYIMCSPSISTTISRSS